MQNYIQDIIKPASDITDYLHWVSQKHTNVSILIIQDCFYLL